MSPPVLKMQFVSDALVDQVLAGRKTASVAALDETLEELAARNAVTPQALFEVMAPAPAPGSPTTPPKIPPPGTGRQELGVFCAAYGLDPHTVIADLAAAGIAADPAQTLRAIAAAHDMDADGVYELIGQSALRRE